LFKENVLGFLVKKNNDTTHLPLESCYLGRSALKMLTGDIPNPSKCFSLIRKAKSARIRQDLLEKSAQTSKTKKTSDHTAITGSRRSMDEHSKQKTVLTNNCFDFVHFLFQSHFIHHRVRYLNHRMLVFSNRIKLVQHRV